MKKEREVAKSMQAGLMALLSVKLTDMSYTFQEKDYCPTWAKKNAEELYVAYHSLGGNGSITDAYQRLMNLPIEKPQKVIDQPKPANKSK